jgi:crotonobetainyl-CoA:carnitine CoA-transferase CaiB-like acyl-CoA transferase
VAPVALPGETHDDQQVVANGYLQDTTMLDGTALTVASSPAQFDEQPGRTERAPEHGEHTEEVLLEFGYSWDDIAALKKHGAIL